VELVVKKGFCWQARFSLSLVHAAGNAKIVRQDSERCVGCIECHQKSAIWMRITSLGPSQIQSMAWARYL
jgi:hypothetical protein